jgi:hypothetical protein
MPIECEMRSFFKPLIPLNGAKVQQNTYTAKYFPNFILQEANFLLSLLLLSVLLALPLQGELEGASLLLLSLLLYS